MSDAPWYFNPLLLTPFFGLFGVIVGGLITAGSSFFLERRREERERERNKREQEVKVRTAARLVDLDFRIARATAEVSATNKRWITTAAKPLSLENWEKSCGVLAPELSHEDWIMLVQAARAVDHINNGREPARNSGNLDISDARIKGIQSMAEYLRKAERVLLKIGGAPPTASSERADSPTVVESIPTASPQ